MLVPTLRPGDIVIMDNLGSHKRQAIRRAIRAAGAKLLFLPTYSPGLNPIEQVFAKLKTLLRKLDARSLEATWRGTGQLLAAFTANECGQLLHQRRICFSLRESRSNILADGVYGMARPLPPGPVEYRSFDPPEEGADR
jgi:hypothetical protein